MGYPIMVIITNKECGICHKMRGDTGWPKNTNIVFDSNGNSWNNEYFTSLLKRKKDSNQSYNQKSRVIDITYDKLIEDPKIIEITFFDLDTKNNLKVNKYKRKDNYTVHSVKNSKTNFLENIKIDINFDTFISKYVPVTQIKNYLHTYPLHIFFHNQVWDSSIINNTPLYGRIQGYHTIRKENETLERYKVEKSKYMILEEKNRNPIDIIDKLIDHKLIPLELPSW